MREGEGERGRGREREMTKEAFLYFEGRMMNIKSIRDYLSSCHRKFVLARVHNKFHFLPFFQKDTTIVGSSISYGLDDLVNFILSLFFQPML